MDVPPAILVLGVITGLTYGVLAIGLILVYRSSGIINFAHGNVGGVAAAVMGRLSLSLGLPWLVVFPIALACGALAAATLEFVVIRRLRGAPRIMAIVATLGAAQLLLGLAGSITHIRNTALFPPPFNLTFQVGSLVITPYYVLILIMSPVIIAALALFLSPPEWLPQRLRSRYGPAMRAAADNPEAARTAGISTSAMSTMAWAIAGALAAFSAILIAPARGFQTIDALGPDLLVRALAPAVLAMMARFPVALLAGVAIGVFEQAMLWNFTSPGLVEGSLFAIILIGLLVRRRSGEETSDASWLSFPQERPVPEHLLGVWSIKNLGKVTALAIVLIAIVLPVALSNAQASIFVSIFTLATIGLSVTIVTGMTGQVSLGQFALAGFGALAGYLVFIVAGLPWGLSLMAGALGGAIASMIIGLPALRLRGLMLAVTSLAFAVMAPVSIFGNRLAFGTGIDPGRPIIGSAETVTVRAYYYIALTALLLCAWLLFNLKNGGLGRVLTAVRDGEDVARAFGISATGRKMQAFILSGMIAGFGGVIFAQSLSRITIETFPADRSVTLLAMVVLGGITRVSGAILGATYLVGLPLIIPIDTIQLMVSGVGVLVFVLYVPGGLAQILEFFHERAIKRLAEKSGIDYQEDEPEEEGSLVGRSASLPIAAGETVIGPKTILAANEISVSYGEVRALDGMSIDVLEHETVGIIGPNGSGKTTLFKVLSGFLIPVSGTIAFDGRNISGMKPESRARLGLIRSFQDSMLFPTLTVLDSIRVSLEKKHPTQTLSVVLGLPDARWAEKDKDRAARALVELLGLTRFRNKPVGELSTGTRRITEMACLLALEPRVLLLDEPSSGIAQRETEALAELLLAVKRTIGTTLVVIEHDMPLIMGISDRIVAMGSGTKVTEGTPSVVQEHPAVIESYLGTDPGAISRSGGRSRKAAV
ncbi:MAG: ATP-binding cassette domain-containing protein [Actinobacteria bacterium]|nr:ATP-binding cassette domain-containing protein [Actinomycetota bacterium]